MARIVSTSVRAGHSLFWRTRSKEANGNQAAEPRFLKPLIHRQRLTMSSRQRLLGIAALLLATSSWGGMFLVSKGVLHHVEPVWFTLIRYSMSALLFVLLILPRGAAPWRKLRLHAGPLALRGFAGFGVFSVMLLVGLAHSVPSHGAVIVATTPMTTQLLRWALDGVRPTRSTL